MSYGAPFKESAKERMLRRSLNFAGWTCSNCHALNPDYTDAVISEDAAHVKTIVSGTAVVVCQKCGAAKP